MPKWLKTQLDKHPDEQPLAMVLIYKEGAEVSANQKLQHLAYLLHFTADELESMAEEGVNS
jgi:hypothetical protein